MSCVIVLSLPLEVGGTTVVVTLTLTLVTWCSDVISLEANYHVVQEDAQMARCLIDDHTRQYSVVCKKKLGAPTPAT